MSDQPCPKCGHCDKCGRSNTPAQVHPYGVYPYMPYPYVYPKPWNQYYQPYYYSNIASGNNINCAVSSQYTLSSNTI